MISVRCARPAAQQHSASARAAPAASTAMYGAASSPVPELRTRFPRSLFSVHQRCIVSASQPPSTRQGLYPITSLAVNTTAALLSSRYFPLPGTKPQWCSPLGSTLSCCLLICDSFCCTTGSCGYVKLIRRHSRCNNCS